MSDNDIFDNWLDAVTKLIHKKKLSKIFILQICDYNHIEIFFLPCMLIN